MRISIVNMSAISDEEVHRVVRAINNQIEHDFAPYWHMSATLRLEGRARLRPGKDPGRDRHPDVRGDAIIYLWDDVSATDALGYHDLSNAGLPYGFVFTELSRSLGELWSVTLSHEALELIGDATANLLAAGPHPGEPDRQVFHWYEMCDAVQAESYGIDGILVSNFVLPLYFTPDQEKGARNDFLGKVRKDGSTLPSFGINPGGYVGFFDPESKSHDTFSLAGDQLAQQRLTVKAAVGSARRAARYRGLGTTPAPTHRARAADELATARVAATVPPAQAAKDGNAAKAGDLPKLGDSDLALFEQRLATDPDGTLLAVKHVLGDVASTWDVERLRGFIKIVKTEHDPAHAATVKRAAITFGLPGSKNLPAGFSFEGMTPQIPIEPTNCQFEEERDAWGWIRHSGWAFINEKTKSILKAPFREPAAAPYLDTPDGPVTSVALLADFGTGLYHARYNARHIESFAPKYAFHLGDVYYAGKEQEFRDRFANVLKPILEKGTELFALNSNHEMLSGGAWYYEYLDDKRGSYGEAKQRQKSSLFTLQVGRFRFIAIDTDYHQGGRLPASLKGWLGTQLARSGTDGQINILLSANQPYNLGSPNLTTLYQEDLKDFASQGLIDLWFWGNTHYCALYDRRDAAAGGKPVLPFVGSCIGHAGYPYDVIRDPEKKKSASAADVRFLEDKSRFWGTNVRPDRGNNGFVLMTLKHDTGEIVLEYIDWRKIRRATCTLGADAAGVVRIKTVNVTA